MNPGQAPEMSPGAATERRDVPNSPPDGGIDAHTGSLGPIVDGPGPRPGRPLPDLLPIEAACFAYAPTDRVGSRVATLD